MTHFLVYHSKKITERRSSEGAYLPLMPDFFMRTRKKIRREGGLYLYPNFGVYSKNITVGGGGIMPNFFDAY